MGKYYSAGPKSSLRTRDTMVLVLIPRVQWWEIVENIGYGESGDEKRYEVRAFYSERKSFSMADYGTKAAALACLNSIEAAIDNNDLSSFFYLGDDGKRYITNG